MNLRRQILCLLLILPPVVALALLSVQEPAPTTAGRDSVADNGTVFEATMPIVATEPFNFLPLEQKDMFIHRPAYYVPSPATPLVSFFLPKPEIPTPLVARPTADVVPMYDLWVSVLRDQPRPKRADEFLPHLKRIFVEEGVPAELAWIPEIESMFDPRARNQSGARGLFQLMPITARAQGLRLRPFDERTNPEKSARAAAMLLRQLHAMFDSWPLALAAYNAGEGRVRRTLQAGDATTFAEIADALPIETRLYVPKVLATLAVREGVSPGALPAPRYIAQTGL